MAAGEAGGDAVVKGTIGATSWGEGKAVALGVLPAVAAAATAAMAVASTPRPAVTWPPVTAAAAPTEAMLSHTLREIPCRDS